MTEPLWTDVDDYIADRLLPADPAPARILAAATEAGLPPIAVSPPQGALLGLLAQSVSARRVLEVGTLGGYSTWWLARALPADGLVVTLELDPHHAAVARSSLDSAEVGGRVDIRVGPALATLEAMTTEDTPPFDLAFIDADKASNADYTRHALRLSRPGSLIVVDNVVRDGTLLDADSADAGVRGTRALYDYLAAEPRLQATAIQTVGSKGYDGFVLARVV